MVIVVVRGIFKTVGRVHIPVGIPGIIVHIDIVVCVKEIGSIGGIVPTGAGIFVNVIFYFVEDTGVGLIVAFLFIAVMDRNHGNKKSAGG